MDTFSSFGGGARAVGFQRLRHLFEELETLDVGLLEIFAKVGAASVLDW